MKRTLYRSDTNRIIAGVCQGLGEYLGIAPLIVRIGAVMLAMANGAGLVLYLIGWLMIPRRGATFANQDEMLRHNAGEIGPRARELTQRARSGVREDEAVDPWTAEPEAPQNSLLLGGIILVSAGSLLLMRNIGLFACMLTG